MAKLEKAFQIAHRSRTAPGKRVDFTASPRESVTLTGNTGFDAPSYSWEGGTGYGYGFLASPPPGIGAGYTQDYGPYRNDLRFVSFRGSLDSGWNLVHEGKGKGQNYDKIYANRSLRTELYSFRDAGDSTWRCFSGGHVASTIIPSGGVSAKVGANGLDEITLESYSPNVLLDNFSLPQMPYILASIANAERFAQAFQAQNGYLPSPATPPNPLPDTLAKRRLNIQKERGYLLQGQGQGGLADSGYVDPINGFANHNRDDYNMTVGVLMQPIPANDLHVMNKLSGSRVVCEWIANHFKANGKPLSDTFLMEVLTNKDPEHDLMHFEMDGTFNAMAQEAAKHGCWLPYWDSRGGYHFVPDTCSIALAEIPIAFTVENGTSLFGEFDVSPGTTSVRVDRVGVKGQEFLNFGDSTTDPMTNYYNQRIGRTWPVDKPIGGNEVHFDGYMGKDMLEQARRQWAKSNASAPFGTNLTWSNIPYPDMVMGMLGKVGAFKIKDPKGGFDFTETDHTFKQPELTYRGGKLFKCVAVSGEIKTDSKYGGSWLCDAQFEEVIARP